MYQILKKICAVPSVSGREDAIRSCLADLVTPYADEVKTDALGNLIAIRRGTAKEPRVRMLCAHMDEIGFLVTFIEENGMIRVAPVGGIHWSAVAYSHVLSNKGVRGVCVPAEDAKPAEYAFDKFLIDIGAKSEKEARRKVSVGDFFVVAPSLYRLSASRIAGRPLDDRIGCAVLLELARRFWKSPPHDDLYFVFSVQEEVGCRGAKPAAFAIEPHDALVFDVTGTGDAVGAKPMACTLSGGAAIKVSDRSVICHTEVVDTLIAVAKQKKIPHQLEILNHGGTDTSAIQTAGIGSRVGAISIPTRYIHSGTELLDLDDAEATCDLAEAYLRQ